MIDKTNMPSVQHQLKLEAVSIRLHGETLVSLDTTLTGGDIITVMGPSGSGKSSLLAYLAGFLPPVFEASGRIWLDDVDVSGMAAEQRGIGLLFQDSLLFPHMTVAGNLRFALPAGTRDKKAWIEDSLKSVGLSGYGERDPDTLSGGQKARVALVRLLLSQPHAVLLDEPFSKLDAHLRGETRALVFAQLRAAGLPTVLVTHDAEDAKAAGGVIVSL